jgi:uncharacterized protein YutE (UPF0331/DUF86 family)
VTGALPERLAAAYAEVGRLRRFAALRYDEFIADEDRLAAVERYLHRTLERCLDLGRAVIARNRWPEPATNRGVFEVLAAHGVVPKERLPVLINMAGMRNILVHEYERLDPKVLYAVVTRHLDDLEAYLADVARFVREGI